ncbi:MAG TPA: DUF6763 family protein [Steroidobacteraceae bacterium]|nr:DUF6763 family protein [Steroidobacteraceae bacterium]
MSRDYDPEPGQWYEDLDREEIFKVISLDPDEASLRLQWLDGEVEEIDLDAWAEMDVELADEPEGWVDEEDDDDDEDDDEDEDDWDDDEDDWDEDEDEDEDWDDLDDDDDYRDRE